MAADLSGKIDNHNEVVLESSVDKFRDYEGILSKGILYRCGLSGAARLMPFVVDSTVVLAWMLPGKPLAELNGLFDRLVTELVVAPPVWSLEIGNVLLLAVRQMQLTTRDMNRLLQEVRALPIEIDETSTKASFNETLILV